MLESHHQQIQDLEADSLALIHNLAPLVVQSAAAEFLGWASTALPKTNLGKLKSDFQEKKKL